VSVPSHESERSQWMCIRGIDFATINTIF